MSEETVKRLEESSSRSELSPALASPEFVPGLDLPSMSPSQSSPNGSLPSALSSVDVARESRDVMDNYIEELGTHPDQAVHMVEQYVNSPNFPSTPTGPKGFTSSICAIKNGRKTMEDRHIMIHNLNKTLNLQTTKQYSYYAIFDGHAGVDAASYSTAHLHHNLVATEAFSQGRIEDAFREAFELTDTMYIKRCKEEGIEQLKPSGTTALCALIEDKKTVYLAWVGDSQAVLVRNGCHEEIMLPHKPDLESERIRIQELGGLVVFVDTWRVNGILSVTRAIGDPDHKPYVIAEPSFSQFEIDPSLDFLVLGCDGLFDQLTGQDIASYVFEFLCKNETRDPQEVIYDVSAYLSKMAIREGSSDNITSIVLFFKPFEQLVATTESEVLQESAKEVEALPSASLPTTNGGHFPYTDFSELPIGANFNLHAMPMVSDNLIPVEQPIEQDTEQNNLTISENILDSKMTTTFDEHAITDLPTEWSYHQEAFALETPLLVPQSKLVEKETKPIEELSQTPLLQPEPNECFIATEIQVENNLQPNMALNPFAMEVNGHIGEQQVNDKVGDLFDNADVPIADHPAVEENTLLSGMSQEKPVIPTEPEPFEKLFDYSAESIVDSTSIDLVGLADQNVTSALLASNEISAVASEFLLDHEELSPVNEPDLPDDSVPDIVQHASDSGFCYTNSISEFSTSFPSENKIEDNFCSTPVQNDPMAQQIEENESGLIDNPNSILQATPNESQAPSIEGTSSNINVENDVDQSYNNWETSLQNNSLLIDTSTQSKELISSDITPEVQSELIYHPQLETGEAIDHFNPDNDLTFTEQYKEPQLQTSQVKDFCFEEPSNTITSDVVITTNEQINQQQSELIDNKLFVSNTEPIVDLTDLVQLDNKIAEPIQEEICFLQTAPDLKSSVDMADQFVSELNVQLNNHEQVQVVSSSESQVDPTELPISTEVVSSSEVVSLSQEVETTQKEIISEELPVVPQIEIAINEIDVPQQPVVESVSSTENVISDVVNKAPQAEPEQPKNDKQSSKSKVVSVPGIKKPLGSTLAAKTKTVTSSRVINTLSKPSTIKPAITKTATKLITTTTATRTVPIKTIPKPTIITKPASTIPKSTTSTLKTRSSPATTKTIANSTSRVPTTSKPLITTAAAKTATKTTASAPVPRVASTVKSTSTTTRTHVSSVTLKSTESKPLIRKSLPASIKPSLSGVAKPTQSTLARPSPARNPSLSASTSRPKTDSATGSVSSKVGSVRPAATRTVPKVTSSIPSKLATSKPVNGVTTTSGIKAVKKPTTTTKLTEPKSSDSLAQPNGTIKSSTYSSKRQIGVENSLKQELEDAVLNGLNGGSIPTSNEIVNGHNGQ